MGERKFVQTVHVTWPKWPPCPYMVKIFFYGTKRPMTLKLGMHHRMLKYYQVCSNDNLGWTWPILWQGQIWSLMLLYGKKIKQWILSETIVVYDLKLATDDRSDKKFLLSSKLCPLGTVCPLPRGYIHVLNHEQIVLNQTSKRFLWNLQQMGKVIRPFCWHQNFVPWGTVCPCPGAMYMY